MSTTARKKRPVRKNAAAKDASRAAILAAAARVFADRGLDGARIEAIGEAAGVNKALLYYYFASKRELFAAVVEEQFREFNEKAIGVINAPGSARAVLLRYVEMHFDSISARCRVASLHQHFMTAGKLVQPLVQKYAKPRGEALAKLLERGIVAGEFRRVDVRHTIISLMSLIVHYFTIAPILKQVDATDSFSELELARRKAALLDFVRHAIFRDPEAPIS